MKNKIININPDMINIGVLYKTECINENLIDFIDFIKLFQKHGYAEQIYDYTFEFDNCLVHFIQYNDDIDNSDFKYIYTTDFEDNTMKNVVKVDSDEHWIRNLKLLLVELNLEKEFHYSVTTEIPWMENSEDYYIMEEDDEYPILSYYNFKTYKSAVSFILRESRKKNKEITQNIEKYKQMSHGCNDCDKSMKYINDIVNYKSQLRKNIELYNYWFKEYKQCAN